MQRWREVDCQASEHGAADRDQASSMRSGEKQGGHRHVPICLSTLSSAGDDGCNAGATGAEGTANSNSCCALCIEV